MTTSSLKPGDIIEVDKKGRRFHGLVTEHNGTVRFRPLEPAISYRTCTSREVIGIWHANKATAARKLA